MEIRGKVIAVQQLQTGEGRNGMWKKQEYVIEHDSNAQYPRKMMFNLWGDKIDQYSIREGQAIRVSFDIDCREYNGRWYNDIRAWKVEPDDGSESGGMLPNDGFIQPAGIAQQPTYQPVESLLETGFSAGDQTSDLPF